MDQRPLFWQTNTPRSAKIGGPKYRDKSLRIASDELFEKAQKRSQDISNPDGRLKRGGKVKYLLSGLLKCDECGANYILTSKTSYQCSGSVGGITAAATD